MSGQGQEPPPGSAQGQAFRGRGQFRGRGAQPAAGPGAGAGPGQGRGIRQAVMANIGQYGVGQIGGQQPPAAGGPAPPRPPTAGRGRAGPGQGAVGGQQESWMFIPGYRYPVGTQIYFPTPGIRAMRDANYWQGHRPRHPQGLGPRPQVDPHDQDLSGWEHHRPPHMYVPEGVRLPDDWYLFWPWTNWHNGWQWDFSRMHQTRHVDSVRGWQF